MPSFKITAITDDSVFIDADYEDGYDHSNMRVIVGVNIPVYTDAADLQKKLSAYVQMRIDEQNERKAMADARQDVEALVGVVVPVTLTPAPVPTATLRPL